MCGLKFPEMGNKLINRKDNSTVEMRKSMDSRNAGMPFCYLGLGEGRHEHICTYLHIVSLEKIVLSKSKTHLEMKIIFRLPY